MPPSIKFTAAYHFWNFYSLEKGKERDKKLENIEPWLLLSNFTYALLLLLITGFLAALRDEPGLIALCFLVVVLLVIQYHFQRGICGFAILRNNDLMLKKSDFKDLANELLDGLEDIFGTFFKDNKEFSTYETNQKHEKNNQQQSNEDNNTFKDENKQSAEDDAAFKNNQQQDSKNDSEFRDYDNNSLNIIEAILKKYNLPLDADKQTIKKCYRNLSKQYHPDSPTGDTLRFIELGKDIEFLIESLKKNQSA